MNVNLFDDTAAQVFPFRSNDLAVDEKPDGDMSSFPADTPLAMAYVPYQQWREVYSEEEAMCSGTLFPELVRPFKGGGSR